MPDGEFEKMTGIQEKGALGFHGDCSHARSSGGFKGARPDNRNVKSHVLPRFGDFHNDSLAVTKLTATSDRCISSVKSLHCKNSSFLDHDGLADVESADFLGQTKPKVHIIQESRFWFRPCNETLGSQMTLKIG